MKELKTNTFKLYRGFTLVELILVVFILSIAALVAVPMFSSAADIQVRSTANRIAADLDYARGLAITRQKNYTLVFNPTGESYDIREAGGDLTDRITNPLDNRPFAVDLTTDSRVGGVNIVSVQDEASAPLADNAITFDYLGAPYEGNAVPVSGSQFNTKGVITLRSRDASFSLTVKVEPMTGYVTIE
jgi:prepilin-type N-terminal cleavage/methylation domain-containing protein